MWSKIVSIFKVLEGVILIYAAFKFLEWYVKGHFGRYFILFWLNTIFSFVIYFNRQSKMEEYDHRTGAEVWNEMHR